MTLHWEKVFLQSGQVGENLGRNIIFKIIPSCLKMIFEGGGIIEIIHSCLKMIFKEGGMIEIMSTFVYFMKPKRCDSNLFLLEIIQVSFHPMLWIHLILIWSGF